MKSRSDWERTCTKRMKPAGRTAVRRWTLMGAVVVSLCVATVNVAPAQTFVSLHSFAGTGGSDGAAPGYGSLVQALDGNLYETTVQGGVNCPLEGTLGCGEIFKVSGAGSISGIYKFCAVGSCTDGYFPEGGLTLNTDGSLYGMTDLG